MDLSKRIADVMAIDSQARALQFDGEWLTWGDLSAIGEGIEQHLDAHGLGEGTSIGIVLRNAPPVVGAMLSTLRTRRCIGSLSPIQPDAKLASDVVTVRPAVLVATTFDWDRPGVDEAAAEVGALGIELTGDSAEPVRLRPGLEAPKGSDHAEVPAGVAVSMLTSGTTGPPKRIPIRYQDFEEALLGAQDHITGSRVETPTKLRKGVVIVSLSLVHISGTWAVVMSAVDGRAVSLLERFDVWKWAELVKEHQSIAGGLPPTGMRMVLDANIPKEYFSTMRAFRAGAAPLDPNLALEFEEKYGVPVLVSYGATEFTGEVAGWNIDIWHKWHDTKRGSVGLPHPGIELRVLDVETGEEVGSGDSGVLAIKSPHSAGAGTSDWVRTNDLARIDEDGFLWIEGRADDVIIRGGFKVAAGEVQATLELHPSVLEAAVVGLPDERLGEVPAGAVVLRSGAPVPQEEELIAWVKERLAPYKVPTRIRVLDDLPRNPALKVVRPALRALLDGD